MEGLFQPEFTNAFQLKQGLKELKRKRKNKNKKTSFLNKSNVDLHHLKDFHRKGTGDSFYCSFYLGTSNGREGMCQLRVRLLWRHTYLSQSHIPKGWLEVLCASLNRITLSILLWKSYTTHLLYCSSKSAWDLPPVWSSTDNRLQLDGKHERRRP